MYTLAATNPPKTVLNRIESICANFLWGEGEHSCKTIGLFGENDVALLMKMVWVLEELLILLFPSQ